MASRGGHKPGAGRPPKFKELKVISLIDETIGDNGKIELIRKLYEGAMQGSFNHLQLLCYYRFGKPSEKIIIENEEPPSYNPVIKIIALDSKIEKLMRDKADSGHVDLIRDQRRAAVENIIAEVAQEYTPVTTTKKIKQ